MMFRVLKPEHQLEVLTSAARTGTNLYSLDCTRPAVLPHQAIADLTKCGQRLPARLHRTTAGHAMTLALHV